MNRWFNKVALLTDAAFGYGSRIAELLVEHGIIVVGTAHKIDYLQSLSESLSSKTGKLIPYKFDLYDADEETIDKLFDWVKKNVGSIQIVIGNIGHCGEFFLSEARGEYNRKAINLTKVLTKSTEELTNNNLSGYVIPLCISSHEFFGNISRGHVALTAFVEELKTETSKAQKNFTILVINDDKEEPFFYPNNNFDYTYRNFDYETFTQKFAITEKRITNEISQILFNNV